MSLFKKIISLILFVTATSIATLIPCMAQAADVDHFKTDIFVGGDYGYEVFRIPALQVSEDGTLLAFIEARKDGSADHGDIDLMVRRSTDSGTTWGEPIIIWDEGDITVGNPAPVLDRDTGVIWLPFTIDNDRVLVTSSADNGLTWSEPLDITKDVKQKNWTWYATGPGHAIQLGTGRLLVASDHIPEDGSFHSHVIYSDDHGETWQLGGLLPRHTDESMVVELADGKVMINMRSNHMKNKRAIAVSKDGGESFSSIKFHPDLIEPVCQGSIIRYTTEEEHGKNRLLFSNPADKVRQKMTVKVSYDEGRSWKTEKLLNPGKSGYSDLAILPDGRIAIVYENGEKQYWEKITFERFTIDWLTDGADSFEEK